MKYQITLENKTYEIEVELEEGKVAVENEYSADSVTPDKVNAAPEIVPHVAEKRIQNGTTVSAPLPGNVLSIKVKTGETIKKGQVLVVIEAMKMENEVVSPADGTVREICVSKGQVVATGEVLLVI